MERGEKEGAMLLTRNRNLVFAVSGWLCHYYKSYKGNLGENNIYFVMEYYSPPLTELFLFKLQ